MKSHQIIARAGFWGGMLSTAYANVLASPAPVLTPIYFAVPLGLACLTEAAFAAKEMNAWLRFGVLVASLVPAIISFDHFNHVVRTYGGDAVSANLTSGAIDGTMIVCGIIALLSSSKPVQPTTAQAEEPKPKEIVIPDPPKDVVLPKPKPTVRPSQSAKREAEIAKMQEIWEPIEFLGLSESEQYSEIKIKMGTKSGSVTTRLRDMYRAHCEKEMMNAS
jgi:hypothetical protein